MFNNSWQKCILLDLAMLAFTGVNESNIMEVTTVAHVFQD